MTAFKDWLNGLTSKTTPVDADELYVMDSSGTPGSKKLTWANLKATLANTFLSLTGGTITDTASAGSGSLAGSALAINQTWNTTGTPTAIKINVTDTASNAASLLMDLQVGGVSKASIRKNGRFISAFGNYNTPTYALPNGSGGLATNGTNVYLLDVNNTYCVGINNSGALMIGIDSDALIYRDAANTLAQRNGTNAQTFRLYNTYTDASNYERGFMRWNSNALEIGTEAAGTGVGRNVLLKAGSADIALLTPSSFTLTGGIPVSWSGRGGISASANGFFQMYSNGFSTAFGLKSATDAVASLRNSGDTSGAAFELSEMTAPAAPATNGVRIYAEDNGSGKTRLMALFATGAAVQIAIEP